MGRLACTLNNIRGWYDVRDGIATEAEGLRVVDDHTLEIEVVSNAYLEDDTLGAAWPLYMARWHVGISKLDQVLADDELGQRTHRRRTLQSHLRSRDRPDRAYPRRLGRQALERPARHADHREARAAEHRGRAGAAAHVRRRRARRDARRQRDLRGRARPGTPFNPLLYVSPYGGLWFIKIPTFEPLHDLPLRKALAHGVDMESIVSAVWGPTATHAKGLISSHVPCHNRDADPQPYDPDLARQQLFESTYDGGPDRYWWPLKIDLHRPNMVAMGVAMKEYWKDNLDIDLDVLKLESGVQRRDSSQLRRKGLEFVDSRSELQAVEQGNAHPAVKFPNLRTSMAILHQYP